MKTVDERVINIISEVSGIKKELINPEKHLSDDLELDSFDSTSILTALEENFGINIPDETYDECSTVGGVIEYVKKTIGVGSVWPGR